MSDAKVDPAGLLDELERLKASGVFDPEWVLERIAHCEALGKRVETEGRFRDAWHERDVVWQSIGEDACDWLPVVLRAIDAAMKGDAT